jgi:hypothetical protein
MVQTLICDLVAREISVKQASARVADTSHVSCALGNISNCLESAPNASRELDRFSERRRESYDATQGDDVSLAPLDIWDRAGSSILDALDTRDPMMAICTMVLVKDILYRIGKGQHILQFAKL